MGGRVRKAERTIVPSRDNLLTLDHHGADRNFSLQIGLSSFSKGAPHEIPVRSYGRARWQSTAHCAIVAANIRNGKLESRKQKAESRKQRLLTSVLSSFGLHPLISAF